MTLYIFDKDGTLVGGMKDRPANRPEEQAVLPNVVKKIAELIASGDNTIAIASNQGGVELGYITHADAVELMIDCAKKIGTPDADFDYCPHFKKPCDCRKPKPGMLIRLMSRNSYNPDETIMVGDQESDKQAAKAASVQFIWAKDFFGW